MDHIRAVLMNNATLVIYIFILNNIFIYLDEIRFANSSLESAVFEVGRGGNYADNLGCSAQSSKKFDF